jgi:hypothetical protein
LRADAGVRVQQPLRICLGCRSKAKSVTNNLPLLSVLAAFDIVTVKSFYFFKILFTGLSFEVFHCFAEIFSKCRIA